MVEETVNYSLVIEVRQVFGGISPHVCLTPCVLIMLVKDEEELAAKARVCDTQRINEKIIDFFVDVESRLKKVASQGRGEAVVNLEH